MFIKICGITTEEDALLSIGMGADALGFNFVPGSVRQIRPSVARDIVKRLPGGIMTVGVFRNELRDRVVEITHEAGLQAAQLHGHETVDDSAWVAERVPTMIKAFVAGDPSMDRLIEYGAAAVLVDAPEPGSGKVFDWTLLDGRDRGRPLILAGGLNPLNVGRAIESVQPWGVDVASGVEVTAGRKDPVLVREFITNARQAASDIEPDESELETDSMPYDWRNE